MDTFFFVAGILVAGAAAAVALYVVAYNWYWYLRRDAESSRSPILLMGPLFAFVAVGVFFNAAPDLASPWIWLFPAVVMCVDPAALPLIFRLWLQ